MQEAGWGRIVNVSSGAARGPFPRTGPYSVSKAGLDMLTRQVSSELDDGRVILTAVYPGIVDTEMQALIRGQEAALIGEDTLTRFHDWLARGLLHEAARPARFIVAIIESDDPALQGQVLDIESEEAARLVLSTKTSAAAHMRRCPATHRVMPAKP
jgi:NAD(P)-dependent dehydrogenase (short-subunit alcohol dehydrogenase family)